MSHAGSEFCPFCIAEKQRVEANRILDLKTPRLTTCDRSTLNQLNIMRDKLQRMAGHKLMQIANPSREILNMLNLLIEKLESN